MLVSKNSLQWARSTSLALWVALAGALVGQEAQKQPWQQPYTGPEATGVSVIALWQFNAGNEAKDNSEHGHDLVLRGESRFAVDGRFGSCLESFPADQEHDRPQGALAKDHPGLSPDGAFTIEMWLRPKPEMDDYETVFLLDKKYFHYAKDFPQANQDYCLYLRRAGANQRHVVAYLGYGTDSAAFTSRVVDVEPGQWYHVAFTYDGEGTGRFFWNGKSVGRATHEGRGSVAPGDYHLVLGCRYGSIHAGFPGYLDEVRISKGIVPFFTGSLEVDVSGRRMAFVRMEKDARIPIGIVNDTGKPLRGGKVLVVFAGRSEEFPLPELAPKGAYTIDLPVDTALQPDGYVLRVTATATGDKLREISEEYPVTIVPRPLPNRMPVVMWGSGDFETLRDIGFTHQIVSLVDYARVWSEGCPTEATTSGRAAELAESLDRHLTEGIGAVVTLYPGRWVTGNEELKEKFERVDRNGKPYSRENVCGLFPEVQAFAYNVGASVARSFGHFPALQASLIHTEIRDSTNLCFHEHDRDAFREFSGFDIPSEAVGKSGVQYSKLEGFPENRVIPDDHPILTFYRWFWKKGDGWNQLHTQVHKGLKSTGREDLWTFFDPAVRAPSIWGSGGGVDVISQWTYSYPDPIKIGQATDELFAMADGADHDQQVMKMTQVIWYRSQTAPDLPDNESDRAAWEKEIPDARFITIAPDHMREAFWSKISRPVQGIMYHGWGSLVPASHGSYRFTNAETRQVLTELIRDVVEPLGPTLVQVPDRKSDIAMLESFTAQMFAGRGTYGWSHRWEADLHLVLQWAQLQPRVIYDETILRDGLDGFRALVLPYCDVLTEGVASAIADFQKKGGMIIADEHLTPAIKPDILVESCARSGKADADKAVLQAKASALRRDLDPRYQRYGDSSNADVIVRFRQHGSTDYLFAVNDKRTFGNYVGHHGKVMEEGLSSSAELSVQRSRGWVYDLVRHEPVSTSTAGGRVTFQVSLGPCDGGVFMITEKKIGEVQIDAPTQAQLGCQARIQITVADESGAPVRAVVPVEVQILDPEARPAEFSGYYGASDGQLLITADLAQNSRPGKWTVRATELASGLSRETNFVVQSAGN